MRRQSRRRCGLPLARSSDPGIPAGLPRRKAIALRRMLSRARISNRPDCRSGYRQPVSDARRGSAAVADRKYLQEGDEIVDAPSLGHGRTIVDCREGRKSAAPQACGRKPHPAEACRRTAKYLRERSPIAVPDKNTGDRQPPHSRCLTRYCMPPRKPYYDVGVRTVPGEGLSIATPSLIAVDAKLLTMQLGAIHLLRPAGGVGRGSVTALLGSPSQSSFINRTQPNSRVSNVYRAVLVSALSAHRNHKWFDRCGTPESCSLRTTNQPPGTTMPRRKSSGSR